MNQPLIAQGRAALLLGSKHHKLWYISHGLLHSMSTICLSTYCWWTKSCSTKDDDYPIIYRVFNHPRWLFGILSINSIISWDLDYTLLLFFQQFGAFISQPARLLQLPHARINIRHTGTTSLQSFPTNEMGMGVFHQGFGVVTHNKMSFFMDELTG